jgi:lactoylglutathione lyase
MQHEQRVLVRVSIDAAGRPTPASQFRPGRRRLARWRPPADAMSGNVVLDGEPMIVKLANSWVIINVGGGPTDDKPEVVLEPPADPTRASAFLNFRVADIQAIYQEWRSRGAEFLTPPKVHSREIRCYLRDPDGHLIVVGQTSGVPT